MLYSVPELNPWCCLMSYCLIVLGPSLANTLLYRGLTTCSVAVPYSLRKYDHVTGFYRRLSTMAVMAY